MAQLEQKLLEHGINADSPPPHPPTELISGSEMIPEAPQFTGNEGSPHPENVSSTGTPGVRTAAKAAAKSITSMYPSVPGKEPTFCQVFLADIMRNMANPQPYRSRPPSRPPEEDDAPISGILGGLQDAGPVALPSREVAQRLIRVYFRLTNIGMPLLHEGMLEEKLNLLDDLPREVDLNRTHTTTKSRIAAFFVLEVLAIALSVVQDQEPSGRWLADRYHKTALAALNDTGLPSDVEGIQALLLIGQHAYYHPTLWNAWKIVGAALSLAVELGLHRDPPPGSLSFFELDNMRRTFWVAYAMDRNMSAALCLPCRLSDGAITAKVRMPTGFSRFADR